MNITPLTIYLWQLTDKFGSAVIVFSVACAIFAIVSYVASTYPDLDDEDRPKIRKSGFRCMIVAVTTLLFSAFIPSSNTVAMMVVIPEIAKSKMMQQDLPDIYNAAVKALKDQLTK
jgi:subtilase family serine protease